MKLLKITLLLLLFSSPAFADGKFYIPQDREVIPPDLPYQRAIIAHDGEYELLILQSKFEGEAKDFGWIVPVPSFPRISSMDEEISHEIFSAIDKISKPNLISIKKLLIYCIFIVAAGLIVVLIAQTANRSAQGKGSTKLFFMGKSSTFIFIVLFILFLSYFFGNSMMSVFLPTFSISGKVRILDSRRIGICNVKVIQSDSSENLLLWLAENRYQYDESDRDVFNRYVEQGMCFVVAKITPDYLENAELKTFRSSFLDPLVLLFRCREVFYPLALTGTIGKDTVVLLYVFHENKLIDPSGRMTLRYFGERHINDYMENVIPVQNIISGKFNLKKKGLTKFRARLSAGDMSKDLILEKASNNSPYRESVYVWDAPPYWYLPEYGD